LPLLINPSSAAGGAAITSNISPALMRLTNSELKPVITSSLCPEFFSNSGPISVNTVQIARDAKTFSSAERAVPCDTHANSTHTTTVATARDIMAGCSEKTAQDDNTITASAAKYRTFSS
jgi:hypothetical protein